MPRSEFNEAEQTIIADADAMEASAKKKRQEAYDLRDARDAERPAIDRLIFAASSYCDCGHGMAYDPLGILGKDKGSPLLRPNAWECSAILLGTSDANLNHTPALCFSTWEVKSETQPSANGQTTRTPIKPNPDINPLTEADAP